MIVSRAWQTLVGSLVIRESRRPPPLAIPHVSNGPDILSTVHWLTVLPPSCTSRPRCIQRLHDIGRLCKTTSSHISTVPQPPFAYSAGLGTSMSRDTIWNPSASSEVSASLSTLRPGIGTMSMWEGNSVRLSILSGEPLRHVWNWSRCKQVRIGKRRRGRSLSHPSQVRLRRSQVRQRCPSLASSLPFWIRPPERCAAS